MITLQTCPVCDSNEIAQLFLWLDRSSKHAWNVSRCARCTLAFLNPQPTWKELEPYYSQGYKPYQPPSARELDALLESARATGEYDGIRLESDGRVLEIGPGGGRFLLAAQHLCKSAIGVEPSPAAAEILRRQGCNVFEGHVAQFVDTYTEEPFSLVVMSHVLEHMADPLAALRGLKKVASPSAIIVIRVPNAGSWAFRFVRGDWMGTDLPRHLTHWNLEAMHALARQAGYRVVGFRFDSPPGVVQQAITAGAQYRFKVPAGLVWLAPKFVWRVSEALARKWVTQSTAMNMEVRLGVGN